jgi:hypothetical protein
MKLKLENGNAVLQDGKPVYVKDDGTEIALDAAQVFSTLTARNAEAKQWRERFEAADTTAKLFEGLDAEAARKALHTVSQLDAKQLLDAGKVAERDAAMAKSYEAKVAASEERAAKIETAFKREVIGGAFARSKIISEKLIIPADIAETFFGKHFEISDEKLVAKDMAGNPIYSKSNPGAPATFDEALEIIIDAYPNKDKILLGVGSNGGGTQQSAPANKGFNGKGDLGGDTAQRIAAIGNRFPELPLN